MFRQFTQLFDFDLHYKAKDIKELKTVVFCAKKKKKKNNHFIELYDDTLVTLMQFTSKNSHQYN